MKLQCVMITFNLLLVITSTFDSCAL